jgi:ribosomal protein S12 methylthiotransferase
MKGKRVKTGHTVALLSLGCPKNLVDSERMARALEEEGFKPAGRVDGADILLINTCTFVKEATEESMQKIMEGALLKRRGSVGRLVVAGCLAQRMGERLAAEVPDVDGLIGTAGWPRVAEVCRLVLSENTRPVRMEPWNSQGVYPIRLRSSFGHYGYCIIPSVRGPLRSFPPERLLDEARALARDGVRELLLVGEDTGVYGRDLREGWTLPLLLRELQRLDGIRWVRILYLHPASLDRELLRAAEECDKVCAYLDMPVQHASDRILERMNRPTSKRDLERVLEMAKLSPKRFALRSTVMVGFPGETHADFRELMEFVEAWEFDHLGAFCYSRERGTPAACYSDQVEGAVALERRSEIMELQAGISLKKNKAAIGRLVEVMIDGVRADGLLAGRTQRQAPEVDGVTLVSGREADPGEFVRARITGAEPYDLVAEVSPEGMA